MKRWKGVAAMLGGRWQVPLAICAIVTAGVALYRMRPPKQSVPFDALLADVLALAEAGAYFDAADAAANLLEQEPALPRKDQAILHDALAEVIYRQELLRGLPNHENTELLLEHHQAAIVCGRRPDTRAVLRVGQAYEWLGKTQAATDAYRALLERQPTAQARRSALQGLVRLLDGQPEAAEEWQQYIQALLDEEGVSPGYLWWALQRAVQAALDQENPARARKLLEQHGQRFKRSDLKGYSDYLWASVHVHEGRTELAEPLLDRVDQWLELQTHADAELDRAGFLPAMSRWLRGQIELVEARPQAALERFDEALLLQSHGNLLVATTIGQAQALSMLGRHAAARAVVRETLARLEGDAGTLSVGRPRLRQAVRQLLSKCHEQRDFENALAYLELALELTPEEEVALRLDLLERLGRENEDAAAAAGEGESRQTLRVTAACAYEQAADLARFDEPRHASLLWASAGQFDHAGRSGDARRLLLRFVEGRSLDPRMPQALLRLGQAYAADGQPEEAIDYYRQLIEGYAPLGEASRARLLTAQCLVALGPEGHAEAETILRNLLEDGRVAPQAQVFRDALFELCDRLYQRRAYAPAISHLEDFLVFYPNDPERYRVHFMLADAYRRSAYALRDDQAAGPGEARRRVSCERFRRAAELFGALTDQGEAAADEDRSRALYERLSLFYRADCLFELNEPTTLAEALATYRQGAARYQGEPAALTAQVQIANIHLRQGKMTEAAQAIERARWLLGSIPDRAFAEYGDGMDRAAWDHFLDTMRSSHLFRDVFAGWQ